MNVYIKSIFSLKKITYKNLSFFAYWDEESSFTKQSEVKYFVRLFKSSIGRYSRLNQNCKVAHTKIGNFTAIGKGTTIGPGSHPLNYLSTNSIFYKRNNYRNDWFKPIDFEESTTVIVGNDVWIGTDAMILNGVTVGDGAVIATKSVVTKNVPPYAIVGGVPAKIINYRFSEEIIKRLLDIKWWDFDDDEIKEHLDIFTNPEITIDLLNKHFK